ncbi:MAG: hypothetical protein NZM12_07530 [Steroidobacteraceae bacterium]|nr:hypothetical protein [Steroidobacteraceae bacterium]MDW8260813.1 hypothetical protein [Gammaproteobacteria bacterium]
MLEEAPLMSLRRFFNTTIAALAGCVVLLPAAGAREPVPRGGERFVGEISLIPRGYVGLWRIASRQFFSDSMTEIDTMRGPIRVGACAQVDVWRDKVVKIEVLYEDRC